MSELLAALGAVAGCSAIFWMVVGTLREQLREERLRVNDLLSRLAARSPDEYRAWGFVPEPAPPFEPEPRIYDETGLLSVAAEDRLED